MNNNREELQNYYNDLFKYGNYKRIDNIPDEYKTQEMCDRYAKNKTFDIRLIPEKFITQEICEKYLKKGGNLNNIPKLDKLDLEKLCNIYNYVLIKILLYQQIEFFKCLFLIKIYQTAW